jgi:hypothetical protein
MSWPINCNDAGVQLQGSVVAIDDARPVKPRTGMSMKVEDRPTRGSAILTKTQHPSVLQLDLAIGPICYHVLPLLSLALGFLRHPLRFGLVVALRSYAEPVS